MRWFLSLFLLFSFNCYGAIAEGTNAGFVTATPSGDPGATSGIIDSYVAAVKYTSPADIDKVTEFGWYCSGNPDEAPDFEQGVYAHDAGNDRPGALTDSHVATALSNGVGWKKVNSLNISLSQSTTYWIADQCDNTSAQTSIDYTNNASYKEDYKGAGTTALPSPWGVSDGTVGRILAQYAKYTTAAVTRRIIMISKNYNPVFGVNVLGNELRHNYNN